MGGRRVAVAALASAVLVPVALAASAPAVVLGGLRAPGSTAVAPDGAIWFAQYDGVPQVASLWRLASGSTAPAAMYATPANRIDSPQFDRSGNAYFLVHRSEESSVVRLDRKGVATTLFTTTLTFPEGGESLDHLAVSASGKPYVVVGSFPTWGTFAGNRVLWLKSGGNVELGRLAEGFFSPVATDNGLVYALAAVDGARPLYELRQGPRAASPLARGGTRRCDPVPRPRLRRKPVRVASDFQLLRADASGIHVIDSESAVSAGSQPDFDIDRSGRLWVTWAARGTLERIDP